MEALTEAQSQSWIWGRVNDVYQECRQALHFLTNCELCRGTVYPHTDGYTLTSMVIREHLKSHCYGV